MGVKVVSFYVNLHCSVLVSEGFETPNHSGAGGLREIGGVESHYQLTNPGGRARSSTAQESVC